MNAYHGMLVHFPMALLLLASGIFLLQIWFNQMDTICCGAVKLLLVTGFLAGVLSVIIGFMVWPLEAFTHSPSARNHILMAFCSLAGYLLLCFIYPGSTANWQSSNNVKKIALSLYTLTVSLLLVLTGTLGGNLAGNPSGLPTLLRSLGWDLNYTMYLSNTGLIVVVVISVAILFLAFSGTTKKSV